MKHSMTCREGVAHLMDYTEGRLGAALRGAIEAHVHGCPRCQWFVRTYTAIPGAMREATSSQLPERLERKLHRLVGGSQEA